MRAAPYSSNGTVQREVALRERKPADTISSAILSVSGEGAQPGNTKDFDYYHGVGMGGKSGYEGTEGSGNAGNGNGGAAVIIARVPGTPLPSTTTLFFTGKQPFKYRRSKALEQAMMFVLG